jgi:hypothetical protein
MQAQIAEPDVNSLPNGEFRMMFAQCRNLTNTGPGFSAAWDNVSALGSSFAYRMYQDCDNAAFAMDASFNLPQGAIRAGSYVFHGMFLNCNGASFAMGEAFNLPQGLTEVGSAFAEQMFLNCNGTDFTMNDTFNLPQGIQSCGSLFASYLFNNCSGPGFMVNDVFMLPRLLPSNLSQGGVANYMVGNVNNPQKRSAISIINHPAADPDVWPHTIIPPGFMGTVGSSGNAFADYSALYYAWGGSNQQSDADITFSDKGTGAISFLAPDVAKSYVMVPSRIPLPAMAIDQSVFYRQLDGWAENPDCTGDWDPMQDVLTATGPKTLYLKSIPWLAFADSPAFDVPAATIGVPVAPVGLAAGVSGGRTDSSGNFRFSATELPSWLSLDPATGELSGTPTAAAPAGTATITVTDYSGTAQPIDPLYPDQSASITISYGAASPASYPVLADFGTYTGAEESSETAKVDADLAMFVRLELAGAELPESAYTSEEGSTLLTLHKEYLDGLANGSYAFTAVYTNGTSAPIALVVDVPAAAAGGGTAAYGATPATGGGAPFAAALVLAACLLAGLAAVFAGRRLKSALPRM